MILPPASDHIAPFQVEVPEAAISDLRRRLEAVRWPESETVTDWSQGVPLAKAQELIRYWRDDFDWKGFEARLNAYPQFRTEIDGLGIHFYHIRSPHAEALPILITHGWPGSVVEFFKIIEPLTDPTRFGGRPEDAFDVVLPSLPGYGFSDKPAQTGWDIIRTAKAWAVLMQRLGYAEWVAQGGDWGSCIAHTLGQLRPAGLAAVHVNLPLVFPGVLPEAPTAEEQRALAAIGRFGTQEAGYSTIQMTRPQTLGYALADSPVGQAIWIYEKFHGWTDNQGNPEDILSVDEILDNISIYWLTNSAASSARMYWENSRSPVMGLTAGRIELPMAATVFPHDIYPAPRKWAEALWPNLFYWNELDKGGHFAAFEQPKLFTAEVRAAFHAFRHSRDRAARG